MGSPLRAFCRIVVYLGLTFALIPVQAALLVIGSRRAKALPTRFHRTCCRILGIKLETRGQIAAPGPTLFVANHTSYLDITILGAATNGSFVSKAEVADWPLFGLLARLQRTVFVDRRAREAGAQRDQIAERLEAGDDLILFPEGTSSDGNGTLPFKSALFSAAAIEVRGKPVAVQPVSVAYTRLDGMPLGRNLRPFYAWYGDMDLASHLLGVMGLGTVTVVVEFHPPVTLADFPNRKALARHCESVVANGIAAALSGRAAPPLPLAAPLAGRPA